MATIHKTRKRIRVPEKYLTKRILKSVARRAARVAATEAMARMGYVVTVESGWVVRKFPGGNIEKIHPLQVGKKPIKIALD